MFRAFNFASERCPVIDRHVTRLARFFAAHAAIRKFASFALRVHYRIPLRRREGSVNRSGCDQSHRDRKKFGLSVIYRVSAPRVLSRLYFVGYQGHERKRAYRAPPLVVSFYSFLYQNIKIIREIPILSHGIFINLIRLAILRMNF